MPYDRRKHHRRSIRLPHYDYTSAGAYFVTLSVHQGQCLLGEVVDAEMQRNEWGDIAQEEWLASADIRHELKLDAFVVMPNHVHGIIWLTATDSRAHSRAPLPSEGPLPRHPEGRASLWRPPKSLGAFIAGYKSIVTKRINQLRELPGTPFWQRNYWEHVIRDDQSLRQIREYIQDNPARWTEDQLHPNAPPNAFNQWQPMDCSR